MPAPANTNAVSIPVADFVRSLTLSEKFNLKAGARPNRQVKSVLSDAAALLDGVSASLTKGAEVSVGSAWHGPDLFLNKAEAVTIARSKDRAAYITGNVALKGLPKRVTGQLANIRKSFKLSSDTQAAALALRVYDRVCDNLWRGNGFSIESTANVAASFDTDRVRNKIIRQTP
ncbi:MAG: hypothetical protein PW788_03200 [Micavibrio sp.]|nr:hypothetical protein [Micavibrio sp.]